MTDSSFYLCFVAQYASVCDLQKRQKIILCRAEKSIVNKLSDEIFEPCCLDVLLTTFDIWNNAFLQFI